MTPRRPPDPAPDHRVDDIPRILRALRAAVRDALAQHRRTGNPVAVWREGRVVWVPPEEFPPEV